MKWIFSFTTFFVFYTAAAMAAVITSTATVDVEFNVAGSYTAATLFLEGDSVCEVSLADIENVTGDVQYRMRCSYLHPGFTVKNYTLAVMRDNGELSPHSPEYPFAITDKGPGVGNIIEINGPVTININN